MSPDERGRDVAKGSSTYNQKRRFDETSEPAARFRGDVDPGRATPGDSFVIHQHHTTRLHFDLRLEMFNGKTPVLVSWAVPKNLPLRKGKPTLAIHVEDHPFEYGSFTGSIPSGNYGAGAVRIFDRGTYELLKQEDGKLTFRLEGERLRGSWTMSRRSTNKAGKDEWLIFLKSDDRPEADARPPLQPMLATLVGDAFDDDDWAFEPKWDGVRTFAVCDDATQLVSRNQRDISVAYPELAKVHEQLVAVDAIVDGEIVAFDDGVPSFEKLQSRIHVRDPRDIERLTKQIPVALVLFDIVYLDGRDLTALPYSERRELLERTVVATQQVQVSPAIPGNGTVLFEAARAQALEGIVAKRCDSRYEIGKRSKAWLKIKTTFEADVVIAWWSEGGGSRSGRLGSLVCATYDGGALRYVGGVGTGFTQATLSMLEDQLRPLATADVPFPREALKGKPELRQAHWVRPELVAVVEFRQLTSAGKLRAPSFKGLRDDKSPAECTFDELRRAAGLS
jgi:bifunctional non-homologous end joining protein LigD